MFYATIFFMAVTLFWMLIEMRKPKNFPRGPIWYPIFGSAWRIARLRQKYGMFWRAAADLDNQYGQTGVIGLKLGKDKLVIAFSCEAIKEMMTNEDLDGRPTGIFYETRTWGTRKGILLTDEEFWQDQRRFIVSHLKDFGFARREMVNIIQNEAEHLLKDIQEIIERTSEKSAIVPMHDLFGVYILNTLWHMMAGIRYDKNDIELGQLQIIFHDLFEHIDMVGCLFSHFPVLQHIAPEFSGYSRFLEAHRRMYEFMGKEIENHRKTFNASNEPRDLIDAYLNEMFYNGETQSFSEKQLLAVCLDLFLAGSETTTKSIGFAFMHIIKNPAIQEAIYKELESVVGRNRLPTWEDRVNLPYCDAVVHEAVRMFMSHTFGIPHRAIRDSMLAGYNIPKDTMVVACFPGIFQNSENYPEPHRFRPERFLKDNKLVVPDSYYPFGLGKHRCMGELMGKQNIFLIVATLMQHFKFEVPDGHCQPDDEPLEGATPSPKPYTAKISYRH